MNIIYFNLIYVLQYHAGGVKYTLDVPHELPTLLTEIPPVLIPVPVFTA